MYQFLKKNIKSLVPKEYLFKNELLFRKFYGVFYSGNKHECNVCSNKLRTFIQLESHELLCPFCGSLSRNRRLWELLKKDKHLNGNLLHFSPSRSLYRSLKKIESIDYYSSDFENEFLADYKFDITSIDQEDNKFNTIICYHILEHIVDDKKALNELYRVLKPGGTIFIQTPFKEGSIYENFSIVLPKDRLKHFGQDDHVRIYSVNGLKERLKTAGFKTEEKTFNNQGNGFYFGFNSQETVLIATK
ncbi:methyltransferase domain-containing protein [Mariniflexile soesokkakense]|uniref:Methyltransferase domain-containing protein n=1 Tax=Mariniflexile soesokkakense TaxID=1343160 RepID=A0ABV0A6H2_9FLAO